MIGKILSLLTLLTLTLTLSSCSTKSYTTEFDSTPETWRSPSGEVGKGRHPNAGKFKKVEAIDVTERIIDQADRF